MVGAELTLPFDVEPYGPGDSEYAAGQRLRQRAVAAVGHRFADYVVVDGEFATAPFLHAAGALGVRVVARLKNNLPTLRAAAQARFAEHPPHATFEEDRDRVEVWDADDFDPWDTLQWLTVRVLRYRQHKPDGKIVEAYWLTDLSGQRVPSRALYRLAKSRWEIENEGFNDAKTRRPGTHCPPSHQQSADQLAVDDVRADHRTVVPAAVSPSGPSRAGDGDRVCPPPPAQSVSAASPRYELTAPRRAPPVTDLSLPVVGLTAAAVSPPARRPRSVAKIALRR